MNAENIDIHLFKHFIPIQVRYIDIDQQGHVNNATFLSYIEQGRVEFLNTVLPNNDFQKNGLIIARTEIDYFEPIFLHEKNIICGTRIASWGNKSFIFENILITSQKTLKAFAKSIMVCFDYTQNKSIPVPEEWKDLVREFEKNQAR